MTLPLGREAVTGGAAMPQGMVHSITQAALPLALLLCAGCATPLMKASGAGDNAQVKALLDSGANPNAQNGGAFFAALKNNKLDTMKLLLSRGVSPNSHGTVICPAQKQSKLASMFMKEMSVSQEAPALVIATHAANIEAMKLLLDTGADVDGAVVVKHMPGSLEGKKQLPCNSNTSLIFAAKDGNAAAVKLLLDRCADPNARGGRFDGKTALEWLQKDGGNPDIAKMLQEALIDSSTKLKECRDRSRGTKPSAEPSKPAPAERHEPKRIPVDDSQL